MSDNRRAAHRLQGGVYNVDMDALNKMNTMKKLPMLPGQQQRATPSPSPQGARADGRRSSANGTAPVARSRDPVGTSKEEIKKRDDVWAIWRSWNFNAQAVQKDLVAGKGWPKAMEDAKKARADLGLP